MKKRILVDIKNIASKLKRTPTLQEYTSNKGKFTKHAIEKAFGSGYWLKALSEAGLKQEILSVQDQAGYEIAQLKSELESMKTYIRELEEDTVNATTLRDMIGSPDTTELGEGTDWMTAPRKITSGLTGTPILFLSDIHFDEVVKPAQVNYLNEYNHEIAVRRMKHTFQTAVDLTKKHMMKPKYDGFICALGGDMLSGNIHEELRETNAQKINQSILDIGDLLADGIAGLADEFGRVFVPCVVGNHGRHDRKPRAKNAVFDNYEWLIYQYLVRHFKKDSRITFLIPDGFDAYFTIYGRHYCLTHGDQFFGGAGIAGIFSPLMLGMARKQRRQTSVGEPFDVMMYGHFHQYLHTDLLFGNGSMKGYDEYAYKMNFPYEPPQQGLTIEHPEKRTTFRMPVLCDREARKAKSRLHVFGQ